MSDDFYPMTKWLPTVTLNQKGTHVELDPDLSLWVDHLKSLGYKEGKDFEIRKRDGKKCLFKKGESPFSKAVRPKSRVVELKNYMGQNKELSRKCLTG